MEYSRLFIISGLVAGALSIGGCGKASEPIVIEEPGLLQVHTLEIDTQSGGKWIYVSLADGRIVGESLFGDETGDRYWKEKDGWDIAFCGEYIRTNGGSSGEGSAAIQNFTGKSFNALETAPLDGYLYDGQSDIVIR